MHHKIFIIFVIIVTTFSTSFAYQPVLITISGNMDKVIFDGKWTFFEEWKASSENVISYDDGTRIYLRSAHQGNFIYFFVDVVNDLKYDEGKDSTILCLDRNNKNTTDYNDYCFLVTAGKNLITYQGNESIDNDDYTIIPNHDELIGISNISDQNDRYSKTPHVGYEFRIPTDLVGRSDKYGLFLSVYDSNTQKTHTWPENIETDNNIHVASGTNWGEVISPDKSLPELHYPIFLLMILLILPILGFVKWNGFYRLN